MTREERSEFWRERLVELAASGETQKQWCERNRVPVHQLAYWKRRLSDVGPAGAVETGMEWFPVELKPKAVSVSSGFEVRVGAAHIQVRPGFDPALLAGVVRALAEVAGPGRGELGRGRDHG